MKIWADLEEVPWYDLHTTWEYGQRWGYLVADVPAETVARWQRVQAMARAVHAEIEAAFDAAYASAPGGPPGPGDGQGEQQHGRQAEQHDGNPSSQG